MTNPQSFFIPEFRPLPLLAGGHRQTLAAFFLPAPRAKRQPRRHRIELNDGDVVILNDDCPAAWGPGQPFVLLLHGLAGCHQSAYMQRMADRLTACGVRVFRLDHRGSGAGERLARLPYHAGRSDDVREAVYHCSRLCPGSLGGVAGFSLSGNMLIKMLGEDGRRGCSHPYLACAVAVNPPIDLELCAQALQRSDNRRYDRHFTTLLIGQVQDRIDHVADSPPPRSPFKPSTLREFDNCYTAPVSGFRDVEDYYAQCSGRQFTSTIDRPTLIITSRDDPLIPSTSFETLTVPDCVRVHIAEHGGHLGYLARRGTDPDRRWIDWRVMDWLSAHLRFVVDPAMPTSTTN